MSEITQKPNFMHSGEIKYTITENDKREWDLKYESTLENDLAALCIAQDLSESMVAGISLNKQKANTTKEKRYLKALLDKVASASFGLKMMIDYMQPFYIEFKKKQDAIKKDKTG